MIVVLDTGVLSAITTPNPRSNHVKALGVWAAQMRAKEHLFAIPGIAAYETRRELLRLGSTASVVALNTFCAAPLNLYLPISESVLMKAAQLWAQARNQGKPTTSDHALDGDVILCAQVLEAGYEDDAYIVATTNTKHLSLFVNAAEWQNILP